MSDTRAPAAAAAAEPPVAAAVADSASNGPSSSATAPPAPSTPTPTASASSAGAAEPSLWANTEQTAQRLAESRSDPRARLRLVLAIREALDITQTADVDAWLRVMFGPLTRALSETRPAFTETDVDHRIRAALLEILNRLPLGDSLRPYSAALCALATRQLAVDNEENGLTCIRILFDCHKHYHPTLEAEVQPFIAFFTQLYASWDTNVKYHFNEQFNQLANTCMAAIATHSQTSGSGGGSASVPLQLPPKQLCKATESLKCASESPLAMMMLLQNYQRYVDASVPQLIPLLIKALTQPAHKEPPPLPAALINELTPAGSGDGAVAAGQGDEKAAQDRATLRALERERDSRFRAALSDFYTAQVKCVSFIAHIFRGYAQHIQTQQDTLASCVVQLLQNCPGDFPLARKDLLVAIRHMLLSDFKKALLRQAPKLLDEKLLIGEGKLSFDTLRPLAYATLADVVHQIKGELSLQQLSRIVFVFSRNLHDTSLPLSVQAQSVRILLNLVDQIHRSSDANDGRNNGRTLLVRILHTLTAKLEALQVFIGKLSAHIGRSSALMLAAMDANSNAASGVTYPTLLTLPSLTPVSSAVASKGEEELEDVIRELRLMTSTMVMGLKTILWFDTTHARTRQAEYIRHTRWLAMADPHLLTARMCCRQVHEGEQDHSGDGRQEVSSADGRRRDRHGVQTAGERTALLQDILAARAAAPLHRAAARTGRESQRMQPHSDGRMRSFTVRHTPPLLTRRVSPRVVRCVLFRTSSSSSRRSSLRWRRARSARC